LFYAGTVSDALGLVLFGIAIGLHLGRVKARPASASA